MKLREIIVNITMLAIIETIMENSGFVFFKIKHMETVIIAKATVVKSNIFPTS